MTDTAIQKNSVDEEDRKLVSLVLEGDRAALENLVCRHQDWIFQLAIRMSGDTIQAEDASQEIIIKMISNLASYQGKSRFRTWLYRIAVNHVINMKRRPREMLFSTFEKHEELLQNIPDGPFPNDIKPAEEEYLVEELRTNCLLGMLLCLERTQRLIFILGVIFQIDSRQGGEIMNISAQNFRQRVSRAKSRLGNFMHDRCGLVDEKNPCRCRKKVGSSISAGYIDPGSLRFTGPGLKKLREKASRNRYKVDYMLDSKVVDLFRNMSIRNEKDLTRFLSDLFRRVDVESGQGPLWEA